MNTISIGWFSLLKKIQTNRQEILSLGPLHLNTELKIFRIQIKFRIVNQIIRHVQHNVFFIHLKKNTCNVSSELYLFYIFLVFVK